MIFWFFLNNSGSCVAFLNCFGFSLSCDKLIPVCALGVKPVSSMERQDYANTDCVIIFTFVRKKKQKRLFSPRSQ